MEKSESERVKNRMDKLLSSQKTAALATQGATGPYVNIVAFAADRELRFLLFATSRETRKYGNLCEERRVALLIENSRNREDDFHQAMAVTATGRVSELSGSERERAAGQYLLRHPSLEAFVHAETSALLQMTAETYYLVENFQKVTKLHMQP